MITWDGHLAVLQQRAEYARLGFPLRLITTASAKHLTPAPGGRSAELLPFAVVSRTAAGTPTPHRSTGSHHNNYPKEKDQQR